MNSMPVEKRMFPNPTKGDMMPPTAKPAVPRSAEATPAFSLSHSMANVLEAVKVMPAIERRAKTNVSYIQKLHPCDRAASHAKDSHNMPLLPMCNASFIVGNLTATVEAMADGHGYGICPETQAELHGGKAVMFLHDERSRCDIHEKYSHRKSVL